MLDISIPASALIAGWVAGPLYGINVTLFALCLITFQKRGLKHNNRILLVASIIQILLCTAHVVALLVQIFRGFVVLANNPQRSFLYIIDQSTPEHVTQELVYFTNSLICDGILIWRCYIVWNRSLRLCIPLGAMFTGTAICSYAAIGNLAQLRSDDPVFVSHLGDWLLAMWSLSIAVQVSATLLIAWKIWRTVSWRGMGARRNQLSVFWIIIESGALYSFSTILVLAFYSAKANCGAILGSILGQLSATVPYLILVRVELNARSSQDIIPIMGRGNHDINAHGSSGSQGSNAYWNLRLQR
ncbi:hypothetical protein OF83DRAFT_1169332 [Amylostereum chailletii]|nr:hypothetical protein OF83DRAFT_1169332 [Amylostereum chailletii]